MVFFYSILILIIVLTPNTVELDTCRMFLCTNNDEIDDTDML